MKILTDYLESALDPLKRKAKIKKMVALARNVRFNIIAFRGNSGALLAPTLADACNKNLLMIRTRKGHSRLTIEGAVPKRACFYIIVDDLIDTGETIEIILRAVKRHDERMTCAGIFLYASRNRKKYFISKTNIPRIPIYSV